MNEASRNTGHRDVGNNRSACLKYFENEIKEIGAMNRLAIS